MARTTGGKTPTSRRPAPAQQRASGAHQGQGRAAAGAAGHSPGRKTRRRGWGFRLLPLIAIVGLLALGLRLGDVWQNLLAAGDDAIAETQSQASSASSQDSQAAEATPSPSSQAETPRLETTSGGEDGQLVTAVSGSQEGVQLAQAEEGQGGDGADGSGSDPLSAQDFSGPEEELRQKLEQREQELEARASELDQREATLQAIEERVDQKIKELEKLRDEIKKLVEKHETRNEERLKNLVNIYRRMEPEQAAAIFEDLDMEVMVQVVQNMRDRDAAPIIGKMNPQRARELTKRMAQSKDLPDVSEAMEGGDGSGDQ